ncbi:hypothetical protein BS78_07G019400 [Paspalum vaginatum]|nr:hypothetical protein BS78_07G019400 [Paspalum vaginatum]
MDFFIINSNCTYLPRHKNNSSIHLLLQCPFAQDCWGLLGLSVPVNCSLTEALDTFKADLGVPFLMELVIFMSWSIWLTRNSFIFRGIAPSLNSCLFTFVEVFSVSLLRAKASLVPVLGLWLDSFKSQHVLPGSNVG